MFRILIFTVFLILSLVVRAQEDSVSVNPWKNGTLYIAPHYGFIVPHTAGMLHLIQGHSFGGSVQYLRQSGHTDWERAWYYPQRGFDFTYINTGNMRQFGNQFAMSYIMHLPVFRKYRALNKFGGQSVLSWMGLGLGAGYATKTWDLRENEQAAVIGSHLNVALTLQYQVLALRVSRGQIRTGIRITHLSNGSFKTPNLGTNNASFFIGYIFNHEPLQIDKLRLYRGFKYEYVKSKTTLGLASGFKEIQPPLGKRYSAATLSFLYDKRISFKSSFGAGIDLFYNSSLVPLIERYQGEKPNFTRTMQVGIVGGYTELSNELFNSISKQMSVQIGSIVKNIVK